MGRGDHIKRKPALSSPMRLVIAAMALLVFISCATSPLKSDEAERAEDAGVEEVVEVTGALARFASPMRSAS